MYDPAALKACFNLACAKAEASCDSLMVECMMDNGVKTCNLALEWCVYAGAVVDRFTFLI